MKKWILKKINKRRSNQSNWEKALEKSSDFTKSFYKNNKTNISFSLTFMSTLIDQAIIQQSVLPSLLKDNLQTMDDLKAILPLADVEVSNDITKIEQKLLNGYVMLNLEMHKDKFAFIAVQKEIVRDTSPPEIEFSVIGPKEAFIESLGQNINLIRKRLPIKELIAEEFVIGNLSKTRVAIMYIESIANEENINTVRQRMKEIEFDSLTDSSYIVQLLADNSNSPFPQLLDTERPDRITGILSEGKIAIIVDGSPHVLIGPTTLVEFFSSFEDYFLNWIIASFFRLIRLFAVLFSFLATPLYVAILTYHYELIPKDLVGTLITSRRVVPFPPILEAIFLELTIELLREAGARLPTKVGQTMGIVGGIVIGTASVEAGLTSNVLLIIVALAALASFTTPVYKMGNTIRLLRFPILLFAQLWGLLGVVFSFGILLAHLLRLTSLGQPFLQPIYPPRIQDLKDSFIRLPFKKQTLRPVFLKTKKRIRFNEEKASMEKDIDE